MISKIKTFIAVAALSGTVGANVHAAELTVKKGDTLWDLSKVHNTSVENIQKWNHLSTDLIHPGDVLTIATEKQYTVLKNDTLWDIAQKFQVSVSQIKEWNKLNTDLIHPGLNLVIYQGLTNQNINKPEPVKSAAVSKPSETKAASAPVQVAPAQAAPAQATPAQATPAQATPAPAPKPEAKVSEPEKTKEITVKATAYTASCEGCSGTTATGVDLNANPNAKVIAVDPSVIPLGSKVYVEGYGVATAADTGGAIKGNRIDVFISSEQKAIQWGKKQITIKILN
ncbi:LysM peptidoglycan-binding domain-containing protein [Paenibacillus sp. BSR1-1]|uniref:LysM peptidoglycan-binding and 3D domain-containing protein n=1 Tax=Paenibacillus sp. BSR1-1 TaxID=3020845 RepID=UPI0025B0FBDD|nr:LysM peptidoglycan-binding and 3D domain-containing protein [Paenibacillus sp. BSR1-1]MDN3018771.1 LysM peptidoglycan-binding domain-containing protein [Paenibacillus sp. BSR1-1]